MVTDFLKFMSGSQISIYVGMLMIGISGQYQACISLLEEDAHASKQVPCHRAFFLSTCSGKCLAKPVAEALRALEGSVDLWWDS